MARVKSERINLAGQFQKQIVARPVDMGVQPRLPKSGVGDTLLSFAGKVLSGRVNEINASSAFEAELAVKEASQKLNELFEHDPSLASKSPEDLRREGQLDNLLDLRRVKNPLVAEQTEKEFFANAELSIKERNRKYTYDQTVDTYYRSVMARIPQLAQVAKQDKGQAWKALSNLMSAAEDEGISRDAFLGILLKAQSSKKVTDSPTHNTVIADLLIDRKDGNGKILGGMDYQQALKQAKIKTEAMTQLQQNIRHNELEKEFLDLLPEPSFTRAKLEAWISNNIEKLEATDEDGVRWRSQFDKYHEDQRKTADLSRYYVMGEMSKSTATEKEKQDHYELQLNNWEALTGDPVEAKRRHIEKLAFNNAAHNRLNTELAAGINSITADMLDSLRPEQDLYAQLPAKSAEALQVIDIVYSSGYMHLLPDALQEDVLVLGELTRSAGSDMAQALRILIDSKNGLRRTAKVRWDSARVKDTQSKLESHFSEWFGRNPDSIQPMFARVQYYADVLHKAGAATEDQAIERALELVQKRYIQTGAGVIPLYLQAQADQIEKSFEFVAKRLAEKSLTVDDPNAYSFYPLPNSNHFTVYEGFRPVDTISLKDLIDPEGAIVRERQTDAFHSIREEHKRVQQRRERAKQERKQAKKFKRQSPQRRFNTQP